MTAILRESLGKENLRIAVDATCTADVNDNPRLLVLDPEVRGGLAHESERRCVVHSNHGIPLLVRHLQLPKMLRLAGDPINACQALGASIGPAE